jgi:ribosome-binding factor A
MPREHTRASRLAEQIQRDLAELIRLEVKDPRVSLVTVTAVEVSSDLTHARVFVTTLADAIGGGETVQALQHAAGFLRSRLRATKIRQVPELRFVYGSQLSAACGCRS